MKPVLLLLTILGLTSNLGLVNGCAYFHSFTGSGQQANLTSPNWPYNYHNNADCRYSLSSPAGTQIRMECDVNIEYDSQCAYDRLSVSLSGDSTLADGRLACGQGAFTQTSTSNALTIGFRSDGSNPASNAPFRFYCLLTVVGTAATTTTTTAPAAASGFRNNTCTCGLRNDGSRIVGGTNALVNEFPWRVAMYSQDMGAFCGGTLISPNWVLTAAHCTAAWRGRYPLYADIGDHDLRTVEEATNQVIKCDRIIQHANYDNQTQDNDIALCHLERPVQYSRTIQPICLPWTMLGETFQGRTITASGWGTTSSGGSASPVLRKVDLPMLTTQQCRNYYQGMITDNMICTYSAGKDTCQGDSGGSIDYLEPNFGRYFGIGVVSWGVGCAGENQPGVYAKVTNYLTWIEQNTPGERYCR